MNLPYENYLPDNFASIPDNFEFDSKQAGKLFEKSDITIRRWCNKGKLKYQRKNPYIIKGADIKQKIFEDHYPTIIFKLKAFKDINEQDLKRLLND